jgi:sirohydrochlorin cobaltochelatase
VTGAAAGGDPVLLGVAHGSRDPASQEVVRTTLADAARRRPGLRVADAYVDNASPSIRAALLELAHQGVDDVVVLPLLLTPASHSKTDVAASVQAGRRAHAGMRLRYGRPLGPSPTLVDVLALRLAEAGARDDDPVVLVAGGALDPDANAQVAATARLLWEGRSWPSVDVAFVSTTRPTVPEALSRLRALGHDRVSLARYFLGPGYLPRLAERLAAEVDGVDVVVSAPLGASDALTGLVLTRYDEAVHGDLRMNCDVCQYRVALPGREDAVGAVQEPHAHPDDA